ncbi:tetratricopeptide repeat protein 9C-like isoform X2 [Centruroides vittatus]|uniref:tetratricopeptide repeat protein 9C-like isoform X2 n=1 Tax=Centruroides vittatus TaxID=120091 RepID=UPI00351021CD
MNIEITKNPIKQQISVEEKLQTAKKFKEEGNNLYKSKNYKMAMGKYHRALLYIKGIEEHHQKDNLPSMFYQGNLTQNNTKSLSKNIQEEVKILKADCYNNLADSNIEQYIKLSEEHLQRYKQKERECYKGMFDKLAEVDLSSSG